MFTGIIEDLGVLKKIERQESNICFTFECDFANELKVDQSLAHNGVCLTVTKIDGREYEVVAIKETLEKTNLGDLKVGGKVNLERCMQMGDRLDGHIVQGHVDTTGLCKEVKNEGGSWEFIFTYDNTPYFTIPKGSITVNGTSLTVVQSDKNLFSVCIIPYTYEHTTFQFLQPGDRVNLEFDVIGKYLDQYAKIYLENK